ncbi:hypothetical protein P9173_03125 [Bacillus safensis]|uniref:hypothetical protein n=1 Tax=Bacillus TaxID=1386 RepID=UPI002282C624|nr:MULTISPECIES: hypothetical protein [Bacillus]MCY7543875.1 hypothetical protein [Bacillus safensis]MCY7550363.1 hypothetical protein [Bacillus safensis]MCY7644011.1 hypothetical protein [Bacillus safensis]MCY7654551.1 hypothetical protein [Bacillus safensis]MEC3709134.1 hypothetical protein [Bacillus safensis]
MKRIQLLFSIATALLIIPGCTSNTQPSNKEEAAAEGIDSGDHLSEDSDLWAYSSEINDEDNIDGLNIKVDRILISPSSAHIAIKGSIENIGHSSFETYPASETIKLNTGEEVGPEELIKVSEEGTNELKNKGDRLDFFYVWPMSNTSPNEVTSISLSWAIYEMTGKDISNSTSFAREYTFNQ